MFEKTSPCQKKEMKKRIRKKMKFLVAAIKENSVTLCMPHCHQSQKRKKRENFEMA